MMLPRLDWIQELSDSLNRRSHENIYGAEAVPVAVTEISTRTVKHELQHALPADLAAVVPCAIPADVVRSRKKAPWP
jgi:hypothetical protein